MSTSYLVIYCSCPNQPTAERIATALIDERLAACVTILPGITSVYRWEEQLHSEPELLLIIKTRCDSYAALESRILQLHPYSVPEIIALPIVQGCGDYLEWIDASVGKPPPGCAEQGEHGGAS